MRGKRIKGQRDKGKDLLQVLTKSPSSPSSPSSPHAQCPMPNAQCPMPQFEVIRLQHPSGTCQRKIASHVLIWALPIS
ncbi:MAG: hypothetical protein RMY29_004900 [Nostoc sp. CreGUA01]|nr:hypothetical protein [Nostoc sp. CreGUA01]